VTRLQLETRRRSAASAAEHLANATTPLIRDAWYVVATSEEVTREPRGRDVMETSVVFYRGRDGNPIVLQNRCAHRSFPLAQGTVEDDTLRCRYHGLRYDREGRCVEIPMQSHVPAALRVRAYPVVERPPLVWVWFGEAASDPVQVPHPSWLGAPGWDRYAGYLEIAGSYVHLHENLLDLSHLSFLHATTFGTPEYARAPVEVAVDGSDIQAWRHVTCELPDIYAVPLGSQFISPGLHVNTGHLKNLELATAAIATVRVAQVITPASRERTHYWFVGHRDFALGRPDIDDFMQRAQYAAFAEDQFAIEEIARLERIERACEFSEAHLPSDAPGIAMRRRLKKLADRETVRGAT
jgi:phenylpropionate dioxygenase-like ring-hydroxylating dioxygenase large terminal subunit